ncbi:unnamed protein product [Thelazia callipaeda]|uniref:F-box domain-containing protein n=1 Tax=Thelazia callipaeda TaxID=103827 RepID=A0A0N5CW46_THECL|nr:unnamed protein product [Thelazia callipaeda]
MEDQSERENSSQVYDTEVPMNSVTGTTLALEQLREKLERRESKIEDLRQTIMGLKRVVADQQDEINHLRNLKRNADKMQISKICLPIELIKMIFYHCDAITRCRISSLNKSFAGELSNWIDVQHLYITRVPVEDENNKTIVLHAYQVITNSPYVGVIRTAKAIPMLHNFRNVKTILVESSTLRFLDRCNKIKPEEGFFSLLSRLETAKLCSIRDNLGLLYTLSDFLTLPNLRTLHIRESLTVTELPPLEKIRAPIEDLRICTHRIRLRQLLALCRALSPTLRRLELLLTLILPEGPATNRSAAVIEVAETMTHMQNLSHLTLARTFIKPSTSERVFELLRTFKFLTIITFEALNLNDIIRLSNLFLPPNTKRIIITESVRIDPAWYPLNSASMEFFDIFNDERMPILHDACRKVQRDIIWQFGSLRGMNPITINLQIGLVEVVANKSAPIRFNLRKNDCRVFVWKGKILTRTEYLKINDINIDGVI